MWRLWHWLFGCNYALIKHGYYLEIWRVWEVPNGDQVAKHGSAYLYRKAGNEAFSDSDLQARNFIPLTWDGGPLVKKGNS